MSVIFSRNREAVSTLCSSGVLFKKRYLICRFIYARGLTPSNINIYLRQQRSGTGIPYAVSITASPASCDTGVGNNPFSEEWAVDQEPTWMFESDTTELPHNISILWSNPWWFCLCDSCIGVVNSYQPVINLMDWSSCWILCCLAITAFPFFRIIATTYACISLEVSWSGTFRHQLW